jgi:hypothetical protein
MKKSKASIGNRTRDEPASNAVPKPAVLPRTPFIYLYSVAVSSLHEPVSVFYNVLTAPDSYFYWFVKKTQT